jgi:nucleoside-diphosphate-sugar epimerase
MNVVLTGATGFIGSAVLRELLGRGHMVTTPVRSEDSAAAARVAGGAPVVVALDDADGVAAVLADADAVVHLASPGDETSAGVDAAWVRSVLTALTGTGRTYVHTGGAWVYGNGSDLAEDSPFDPPAITAWRMQVERDVLAGQGMNATILVPGVVPETVAQSRARFGGPFADALLLDQQASGATARTALGWQPSAPPLVVELAAGYSTNS